jgi:hypothetical protein
MNTLHRWLQSLPDRQCNCLRQSACFGLFLVAIAGNAGEKWWTVSLAILLGGLPACLAFFALRRSQQLARALLRSCVSSPSNELRNSLTARYPGENSLRHDWY